MRARATARLSVSLLGAAALHGVVFGAAAFVMSRGAAEPSVPPPPVDVDVVEVTAPKPEPVADSAPASAPTPAKLIVPARRRSVAPTPVAALASNPISDPAVVDSTRARDDEAGPTLAAPAAVPAAPAARGPATAPSAGTVIAAPPRYRSNPKPVYPLPSLRRREEGVVLLNVVVQPDGLPASVTLNRSSGYPLLDRAAMEQVRRSWSWEPVAAPTTVLATIRFSLADEP